MNQTKQFYQLDVFTTTKFGGNPLAVFPDGAGISDQTMQQIARELNLSETVFVLPSDKPEALRRLRIFTPNKELPIAGHPVVGAWNLLAHLGLLENAPPDGAVEIRHELRVGVLPVEIEFAAGLPVKVTMTTGELTLGEIVSDPDVLAEIAAAFNLTTADLARHAPVQTAGIGVEFTIIPVRSLDALKRARPDSGKLASLPKTFPGEFSLWTGETFENNSAIHTRMFAPEFGIVEDPATGSAAGALGGYLAHHNLLDGDDRENAVFRLTVEQGDFINRPSRIAVEVTKKTEKVEKIRVGGASVIVAKGEIFL